MLPAQRERLPAGRPKPDVSYPFSRCRPSHSDAFCPLSQPEEGKTRRLRAHPSLSRRTLAKHRNPKARRPATRRPSPPSRASAAQEATSPRSTRKPRFGWIALLAAALIAGLLVAFLPPHRGRKEKKSPDPSEAFEGGSLRRTEAKEPKQTPEAAAPERFEARVLARYPHDPSAFTQGLLWYRGRLFESTGLYQQSSVREVELRSGKVLQKEALEGSVFAEGLARVGKNLIQLSWQNGRAFLWEMRPFRRIKEFAYEGEGWGLCYDGRQLIMSDGSDMLSIRDPETFALRERIPVRLAGRPLRRLNELECVKGEVYANIWQSSWIARIDAKRGEVKALIDASGLLSEEESRGTDVLNGIAEREGGRFLLTGKYWPKVFEVEFLSSGRALRPDEIRSALHAGSP